jgi:hypothetical protein
MMGEARRGAAQARSDVRCQKAECRSAGAEGILTTKTPRHKEKTASETEEDRRRPVFRQKSERRGTSWLEAGPAFRVYADAGSSLDLTQQHAGKPARHARTSSGATGGRG